MGNVIKMKMYSDPGHGWLAVKRKLVEEIGIDKEISSYSYQRGQTVYLEEDRDAFLFIREIEKRGYEPFVDQRFTDKRSPIRSYDRYEVHNAA